MHLIYNSVEIYVLDGVYTNEFGSFEKGTYLKFPKENEKYVSSETGCIVFRKTNYKHNDEEIVIDTNKSEWLQGHGNLTVVASPCISSIFVKPDASIFFFASLRELPKSIFVL